MASPKTHTDKNQVREKIRKRQPERRRRQRRRKRHRVRQKHASKRHRRLVLIISATKIISVKLTNKLVQSAFPVVSVKMYKNINFIAYPSE